MLREFDLQRMHWADKTQSMLHQRQMEACETRLLSYPTESIFTLQDERETEWWWQCSYDAEESLKSPVLHTLREMRANVLARLPVEAALLTETEHALIVRLILCGGQARIDGWQELSAAESLLRRLWCTLEVDEQDVLGSGGCRHAGGLRRMGGCDQGPTWTPARPFASAPRPQAWRRKMNSWSRVAPTGNRYSPALSKP